jgi:ArsR family transcriptional regulator, arsenate/arsenite/antimonite-responsive transcriptional repressor
MEMIAVIEALNALAHERRLEIFRLLIRHAPEGLAVNDIAQTIPIPPATLSFHLSHLQHSGLLKSKREGRRIIYAAQVGLMQELMGYLTENCCTQGSNPQACDDKQC